MEVSKNYSPSVSDEITLKEIVIKGREYYKFLLSKWIIIILFSTLCAFLGGIYAFLKKPLYMAATTFVLEEPGSGASSVLGGLGGIASMVGIDVGNGGGIFQGDNIVELYKSRNIIQQTLLTKRSTDHELLIDQYIKFNALRKEWDKVPGLRNLTFNTDKPFTRTQDSVLGVITEDIRKTYLSVGKLDKKLSIISAEIRAENEEFAMDFNRAIVKNVNDFYIRTKTKKSLENVNILQQKVDSVRAVMNGAISSAAAVTDATPNLNLTRQKQRVAPVQRSQFSAETNKAILAELVKNLELSKIALRKETPLIQVLDEPVYPLAKQRLSKIKWFVIGGIIGGVLTVSFLILKRLLNNLLS